MKKLITCLTALTGFLASAQAQDMSFGVKGGLNLSNVTNYSGADMKPGFHLGGYASIGFSDKLAFQPEVLFSTKGYKFKSTVTAFGFTSSSEGKDNLNYIEIPLLIKFSPTEMFHVAAGPYAGILAGRKYTYKSTVGNITSEGSSSSTSGLRGFDMGAALGAGVQLESGLNFGARYSFGFTSIGNNSSSSSSSSSSTTSSSSKNSVIQVYVGFGFGGK